MAGKRNITCVPPSLGAPGGNDAIVPSGLGEGGRQPS